MKKYTVTEGNVLDLYKLLTDKKDINEEERLAVLARFNQLASYQK